MSTDQDPNLTDTLQQIDAARAAFLSQMPLHGVSVAQDAAIQLAGEIVNLTCIYVESVLRAVEAAQRKAAKVLQQ